MTPILIAPSLAAADQSRLGWAVQAAERGGAELIHLDIEDGAFLPNLTFGPRTVRDLRPLTGLPFDVHLQVLDPEPYLRELAEAGADRITFQVEATRFPYRLLYILKGLGVKSGLALTAATPLDVLAPVLDDLDLIHLMTAEPNGSGAQFISGLLEKIRLAAQMAAGRSIEVEVDGGIAPQNARSVVEAGATTLVAGRAIGIFERQLSAPLRKDDQSAIAQPSYPTPVGPVPAALPLKRRHVGQSASPLSLPHSVFPSSRDMPHDAPTSSPKLLSTRKASAWTASASSGPAAETSISNPRLTPRVNTLRMLLASTGSLLSVTLATVMSDLN